MKGLRAMARGFSAYFKVIPLFSKLGLWKYLLLTALISFVVLVVIVMLGYGVATYMLTFDWMTIFGEALVFAAAIVAFIAVIALGVLLFKHLVLIATAPWMGKVAEKVSEELTGVSTGSIIQNTSKEHRWALVKRSIRLNARLFAFEMLLTLPLLLLGLIPGVNLAAVVALVVVQSYFVGAASLDFSLEERFNYSESVAYINHNRWLAIGCGLGFVLLLFTAIGFLFAPAWSAAAGAYAFHSQESSQRLQG